MTSGAMLFALRNFIEKLNIKLLLNTPKNESGLTQLMKMGKSIRQIWVKLRFRCRLVTVSVMLTIIKNTATGTAGIVAPPL